MVLAGTRSVRVGVAGVPPWLVTVMSYVSTLPGSAVCPGAAGSPFTEARVLVVVSTAGVGLVAVHAASANWQVPSSEVTTFLISVVPDGRRLSTFTVKRTVTEVGSVALFAAGTGTFCSQAVPAGEGSVATQEGPQPSLGG